MAGCEKLIPFWGSSLRMVPPKPYRVPYAFGRVWFKELDFGPF